LRRLRVQGPVVAFGISDEQSPGAAAPGNPALIEGVMR